MNTKQLLQLITETLEGVSEQKGEKVIFRRRELEIAISQIARKIEELNTVTNIPSLKEYKKLEREYIAWLSSQEDQISCGVITLFIFLRRYDLLDHQAIHNFLKRIN